MLLPSLPVIYLFTLLTQGSPTSPKVLTDDPPIYLEALAGSEVLLPCDFRSPTPQDTSILVLFFRDQNKTPVYSMDSRGLSLNYGIHWNADYLSQRSYLEIENPVTGLVVKNIQLNDTGLYRCRVDFDASPTSNTQIRLRVVEPPLRMSIVGMYKGERDTNDVIGPYPLGARIIISCQVIGGFPPPRVTWWHDGEILDDKSEVRSGGVTRNALNLPKLDHRDLLKTLTCQAVNSNLTTPLTKRVTIDLAFKPHSIRISTNSGLQNHSFSRSSVPLRVTCLEGRKCPLTCHVEGSRPPPLITWKSNGRTLESQFQTISNPLGTQKVTAKDRISASFSSTLMLKPDKGYDEALISCRASSPALPDHQIEDQIRLNIQYPPSLEAQVKNGIDLSNIEENEQVTLECLVEANPPVTSIQWTRDWVPVQHNESAGIIVKEEGSPSGSLLVLRKVKSEMNGYYSCAAANNLGSGTSNVVHLSIKYSPKCSPNQVTSVGVGTSEKVNVTCNVRAQPSVTLFRWAFNTSEKLVDIPFNTQVKSDDSSSTITYEPKSHFDYGDLLCWATNSVGSMKTPCIIRILPIEKPEEVKGCTISFNSTMPGGVIMVKCIPGWDGGLSQTFTLEVRKAAHVHARVLAALQHSSQPIFVLRNLQPSVEYLLTVTSANARGTSPPVTLTYTSPNGDEIGQTDKHSKPQSSLMKLVPYLAIFVALIVILTTCGSVIACIARSRASDKAEMLKIQRKMSYDERKFSSDLSIPPDRGKKDEDDYDLSPKDPDADLYCAVHGHERALNDYVITGTNYPNSISKSFEKQHLLSGSVKECSTIDNHKITPSRHSLLRPISTDHKLKNEQIPGNLLRSVHVEGYHEIQDEKSQLAPLASLESLSLSSNNSMFSRNVVASSPKFSVSCNNDEIHEQNSNCLTSSLARSPLNAGMFKFRSLSDHSNLNSATNHTGTSTPVSYTSNHDDNYTKNKPSHISNSSSYNYSPYSVGVPNSVLLSNPSSNSALFLSNTSNKTVPPYTPSLSTLYPHAVIKKSNHINSSVDPILEHIRNERKISRESSV